MDGKGIIHQITSDNFEKYLKEHDMLILDFWASWCAPCKNFSPVFEKVANIYPDITFAKVDIEKEQELAQVFEIRSVPHLMVFKKGIAIYSESGSMPESTLKELAAQAISADVSAIVAQIDENT
jgi:thioredoxin 1